MTIVVIGCGKMGSALVEGVVEGGAVSGDDLHLCDRSSEKADELATRVGATTVEPESVFDVEAGSGRIFVLAVKPDDVGSLLESGRGAFGADDTVLSIAAGVPTDFLASRAGEAPEIVRAMPNTPALVGAGVTGVYAAEGDVDGSVLELLEGVGSVVELKEESDFHGLTAVSGSGPAYVFVAIEALADGAVEMGLDRETALKLAVETIQGAAELAGRRDEHPAVLKDEVASPGGTTITGLAALEEAGFRGAWMDAVRAAAEKSREMGEELFDDD